MLCPKEARQNGPTVRVMGMLNRAWGKRVEGSHLCLQKMDGKLLRENVPSRKTIGTDIHGLCIGLKERDPGNMEIVGL